MFPEGSRSSRMFGNRRPPLGRVLLGVGPELEGLDALGDLKEFQDGQQQKAPFWEGAPERWT